MNREKKKSNRSSEPEYALVYSTDGLPPQSKTPVASYSGPIKPAINIERAGRGGKTVTVLSKLPNHETLLKEICAFMKKALGSGGTFRIQEGFGIVEIQGDHREQVPALIEKFARKQK